MSDVEKEVERVAKVMWAAHRRHWNSLHPNLKHGIPWRDLETDVRLSLYAQAECVIRDQKRQAKLKKRRVKK